MITTNSIRSELLTQCRTHPIYAMALLVAIIWFAVAIVSGLVYSNFVERRLPPIGLNFLEHGDRALAKGNYQAAFQQFYIAGIIAPDSESVQFKAAVAAHQLGLDQKAQVLLKKAIKLNPNMFQAHYLSGLIHLNNGLNEAAILRNRAVIALHPRYAEAWNNLGLAYMRQRRFVKARQSFLRALEINPALSVSKANLQLLKKQ